MNGQISITRAFPTSRWSMWRSSTEELRQIESITRVLIRETRNLLRLAD